MFVECCNLDQSCENIVGSLTRPHLLPSPLASITNKYSSRDFIVGEDEVLMGVGARYKCSALAAVDTRCFFRLRRSRGFVFGVYSLGMYT